MVSEGSGNGTGIVEMATPAATITASSLILVVLLALIPLWLYLAHRNSNTRSVLIYGWIPVIAAMFISRSVTYIHSLFVLSLSLYCYTVEPLYKDTPEPTIPLLHTFQPLK